MRAPLTHSSLATGAHWQAFPGLPHEAIIVHSDSRRNAAGVRVIDHLLDRVLVLPAGPSDRGGAAPALRAGDADRERVRVPALGRPAGGAAALPRRGVSEGARARV
jgi:hypothetical protein